jgi:hypothetical protein
MESEAFAGPVIELVGHGVEEGFVVHGEISALREVLAQQAVGVLVGPPLPPLTGQSGCYSSRQFASIA